MAVQSPGPDLYELSYEDTKISFEPNGSGRPARVSYSGPLGERSFEGDELQLHESARGLEVSVRFDTHLQTITLTLFVPELELDDVLERSFRSVGIHATQRRTIAGGPGASVTSKPLELEGLARLLAYDDADTALL